ncbi:MAG: NUDIX domain-containing protein [Bacteroidales bacterium]|nr:NUDIX domain-containing protein [Bacteroidales bacterium]
MNRQFTIRIYALIINKKNEILLSDEFRLGMKMTKFPGGGLEFGEGTIDCLKRELMEETGQEIEIIKHFYTTDFFQPALHNPKIQVLSIYYLAKFKDKICFKISNVAFDFNKLEEGNQSFRWQSIEELQEKDLSLPIDKKVLTLLKTNL